MPSMPSRQTGLGARQPSALQAPRPATWDLHFPGTEYVEHDRRALLIRELEVHYSLDIAAISHVAFMSFPH